MHDDMDIDTSEDHTDNSINQDNGPEVDRTISLGESGTRQPTDVTESGKNTVRRYYKTSED